MGRRYQPNYYHPVGNDELWQTILKCQNTLFHTAKGLPFTYTITMLPDGTTGNEMVISRKSKSITRATVDMAYRKVLELGAVTGPKQLGVFGASYLYAVFRGIGVISDESDEC